MPYDAVQRHLAVEKLVTRTGPEGQDRRYYRFRPARWYGGIITADCVGCGLLCRFCWVSDLVLGSPAKAGRFYSPRAVAQNLLLLAERHRINQLRLSGSEPTLGKRHLLQLLKELQREDYTFILETNGIPIAYDKEYAADLSRYGFIHVRVSLKGCSEEEFTALTGASQEGFKLQLGALKNLVGAGVSCHPSVMSSFSTGKSLEALKTRLKQLDPKLEEDVEVEELILYPHVERRLASAGLRYYTGYKPNRVPPEQV